METKKSVTNSDSKLDGSKQKSKNSYWKHLLSQYEKKYAMLESRQDALAERVKFMECALPSLLMGTAKNPKSTSKALDNAQSGIIEN